MAAIFQNTLSNEFYIQWKVRILIKHWLKFVFKGQIGNRQQSNWYTGTTQPHALRNIEFKFIEWYVLELTLHTMSADCHEDIDICQVHVA